MRTMSLNLGRETSKAYTTDPDSADRERRLQAHADRIGQAMFPIVYPPALKRRACYLLKTDRRNRRRLVSSVQDGALVATNWDFTEIVAMPHRGGRPGSPKRTPEAQKTQAFA